MAEIPKEAMSAAILAVHSLGYLTEWASEKVAEAALEAAGVPELLGQIETYRWLDLENREQYQIALASKNTRIAELEADTRRLCWLMDNSGIDGFYGVTNDRYDFAFECADEAGRGEPTEEDEFNGWRRMLDAAMKSAKSAGGE